MGYRVMRHLEKISQGYDAPDATMTGGAAGLGVLGATAGRKLGGGWRSMLAGGALGGLGGGALGMWAGRKVDSGLSNAQDRVQRGRGRMNEIFDHTPRPNVHGR
jgi:uncharacterized membrane protein YebE (DUF533 family)